MSRSLNAFVALLSWILTLNAALAQPAVERLERQVRDKQRARDDADGVGYLGVFADESLAGGHGVEVMEVMDGSPAQKGGLEPGDLVTKVGDQPIRSLNDFAAALRDQPVGKTLRFAIERKGDPKQVEATLVARPPARSRRFPKFGRLGDAAPELPRMSLLGVHVESVDAASAAALGLPVARGAYVTRVREGSPAATAGIPVQAVIVAVDGQEVGDLADLKQIIAATHPGQEIKVDYYSRGKRIERRVRLAETLPDEPALLPEAAPMPPLQAPELTDQQRIEQLEGRVRALEARLAELERIAGGR